MSFYDTAVRETKKWEGVINHMYVDTRGYVTVGVGFMIPRASAAKPYRFIVRATKKAASDQQKEDEYNNVKKQKKAMRASYYKQYTTLDLPEAEVDKEVTQKIKTFERQVKVHYKDYDKYPEEARLALLDMAYNLGTNGLLKFKKMKAAIEAGKWHDAAKESKRHGVRKARNDYVSDLLKAAGKKAAAKPAR